MKNKLLPLSLIFSFIIIGAAFLAAFSHQSNKVLASEVPQPQACCRAGIAQNMCMPGTGNEWRYFSTQQECSAYAAELQTNGYICNSGEGLDASGNPFSGCSWDGTPGQSRVRCHGGISQSIENAAFCAVQPTSTPTPFQPQPTPTPTQPVFSPTPTPTPGNESIPTPTPFPTSVPQPACSVTLQAAFRAANYGGGWSSNLTTSLFQPMQMGAFKNNDYSYFYPNISLRLLGPGINTSPANGSTFTPGSSGDYTLQAYSDGCVAQAFLHILGTYYQSSGGQPLPAGTSSCSNPVLQNKQCTACNISQTTFKDNCGNLSFQVDHNDDYCKNLCPITPTPGAVTPTSPPAGGAWQPAPTQIPLPAARFATVTRIQELPRTGPGLMAWVLSGLVPLGVGLRRFGRGTKAEGDIARFLWQKREFDRS